MSTLFTLPNPRGIILHYAYSLHSVEGTIFEAQDNLPLALVSYTKALRLNIYCVEAFDRLISRHMLTGSQVEQFDILTKYRYVVFL